MSLAGGQRGFSLVEMLVGMTILLFVMAAAMGLILHNSRINKSQQMAVAVQSDARTCMSMIVQKLRTAGWDPTSAGIQVVRLDSTPGDGIEEIEVFADLDSDGATTGSDEQVLIRFIEDRIEWRRSAGGSFEVMAVGISNDANGDGTPEQMFTPDSTADPTRIVVQLTAESPLSDPITGSPIRYTLASDLALRKKL
jgi:prepilin-type N-terminal cleavage/methylation domain-containing protein